MTDFPDFSPGVPFCTVVYKIPPGWKPGPEIMNSPLMSAISWSHAIHDRDAALDQLRKVKEEGADASVRAGHFLPDLYRWMARAHFTRPSDEVIAFRYAEQIKLALEHSIAAESAEDAREKFEAWAKLRAHNGDLQRLENGEYEDYATQCAWSGVKFAFALQEPTPNDTRMQENPGNLDGQKDSQFGSTMDIVKNLLPPMQETAVGELPTLVGIPSIVREALDIAHDLVVAEADNIHTTYAGYKQHKHDAIDRDVAIVKDAMELIKDAPDVELAETFYTRQELAAAYDACAIPEAHFKAIEAVLKAQRRVKENGFPD